MKSAHSSPYKTINCPQCGSSLPLYLAHAKLAQCSSCGSSIFLDDKAARVAGESSVLAPEPSLISLNRPFSYLGDSYFPMGMIRYSYGRGFWEEWWIKDSSQNEYWLSVDEGDIVLERLVPNQDDPQLFKEPMVGKTIGEEWIITEYGIAVCEGFSGSLPKSVAKGDQHNYFHLLGYHAALMTVEINPSGMSTYIGKWISPFDIKGAF